MSLGWWPWVWALAVRARESEFEFPDPCKKPGMDPHVHGSSFGRQTQTAPERLLASSNLWLWAQWDPLSQGSNREEKKIKILLWLLYVHGPAFVFPYSYTWTNTENTTFHKLLRCRGIAAITAAYRPQLPVISSPQNSAFIPSNPHSQCTSKVLHPISVQARIQFCRENSVPVSVSAHR